MLSMSCMRLCSLCTSAKSLSFSFSLLWRSTWEKAKQRFKHGTKANQFSHPDLEGFSHPASATVTVLQVSKVELIELLSWLTLLLQTTMCHRRQLLPKKLLKTHEWATLLRLVRCQTWDKKIWTQRSAYLLRNTWQSPSADAAGSGVNWCQGKGAPRKQPLFIGSHEDT